MKMLTRIYLTISILLAGIGVLQCIRWSSQSGFDGHLTIVLVNFISASVFLALYGVSKKKPRKATHCIALPIGFLVFSFWALATLGIEAFHHATSDVTNPRKYEKVLNKYWSSPKKLVAHFPSSIPADALKVRFSYRQAFLQGGAHIQLCYSASPEKIDELYERFSAQKTKSFQGGSWFWHANAEEGMPTTWFHTSGTKNKDFPDDYEIMIFDRVLTQEERAAGYSWNHGKSHGVAISKLNNEIVYWAESW